MSYFVLYVIFSVVVSIVIVTIKTPDKHLKNNKYMALIGMFAICLMVIWPIVLLGWFIYILSIIIGYVVKILKKVISIKR